MYDTYYRWAYIFFFITRNINNVRCLCIYIKIFKILEERERESFCLHIGSSPFVIHL